MHIEVASLTESGRAFEHQYQPAELCLEDDRITLAEPQPWIRARITHDGRLIKVNGKIRGQLQLECDRCLKPLVAAVEAEFSRDYASAADYESQHAVELSAEDLDLSVFDGSVIDIDALVREELLLAAPAHALCRKDCKGICPACGVDRNVRSCDCEANEIDPRWAGLKELVNRN